MPTRSSVRADDYDTPQGVQQNTFVESEGGAIGGSLVGSDGYIGLSYSTSQAFTAFPARRRWRSASRIDMEQDKILSKGEWRPHANGIDAVRYWFGWSDYAHNELDRRGALTSARASPIARRRRGSRCSTRR